MTPALQKLADTGVGIAIRDFGSDRSGLSYPKHFPVTAIWIDCRSSGVSPKIATQLKSSAP